MRKPVIVLGAIVIMGGAAGLYLLVQRQQASSQPSVKANAPAHDTPPPSVEPTNPVAPTAASVPLPALADSDGLINAEVTDLVGKTQAADFLNSANLVRRIVATIDNLPRRRLNAELYPLKGPKDTFEAAGNDERAVLTKESYTRYQPLMAIVQNVNVPMANDVYRRLYPLFQQAYQDLGYPNGYFNDRLVTVIDNLLATPKTPTTIELVRPKVFFEFADPQLESLSAGQKILLRIGPDNRRVVEQKLIEFRALVARVQ